MNLCVPIPNDWVSAKPSRSVLDAGAATTDIYVIERWPSDGTGEIAGSFGVNVLRNEKNISKAVSIRKVTIHFDLTNER